jgi:hypothetical protein
VIFPKYPPERYTPLPVAASEFLHWNIER